MCWRLFFNPLFSSTSRVDTDERKGIEKMRYRAPSGKGRGICWFPNGRYPSTNTGCSDIEVKVGADHQRCFAARLFTSTFWLHQKLEARRRGISRSSVVTVCARIMRFYTAPNTFILILETVRKKGAQSWPGAWPARQFFILLLCEVIFEVKGLRNDPEVQSTLEPKKSLLGLLEKLWPDWLVSQESIESRISLSFHVIKFRLTDY